MIEDQPLPAAGLSSAARASIWIGLVAVASILFSWVFACATPFAALAVIAGLMMPWRIGLALIIAAWLSNQAVGYLLLGYPRTWDSFAWGAMIGVAAIAATIMAHNLAGRFTASVRIALALIAAFAVYELVLFAATAFLPSGEGAFSFPIVREIFLTDVGALVGLLAMHWGAVRIGLLALPPGDHSLAMRA